MKHLLIRTFVCNSRYFQYLSICGDKTRFNIEIAGIEANQCQDLLSQAQYHVSRARRIDEEEKALRRKQEEERLAFKTKQEEERKRREEEQKTSREQMLVKRQEYVEKTKGLLIISENPTQSKERKKGTVKSIYRKILRIHLNLIYHLHLTMEVVVHAKMATFPILVVMLEKLMVLNVLRRNPENAKRVLVESVNRHKTNMIVTVMAKFNLEKRNKKRRTLKK